MRNLILAAAALTLLAAPAFAAPKNKTDAAATPAAAPAEKKAKAAPKYDCTKKGNANKAACKTEAAAAPAPAVPAKAATPAAKPAPAPVVTPMAAAKPAPAAAPAGKVGPAGKAEPAGKVAPAGKADPASGKTRSAAQLANDNKMKACGAQWDKMTDAQKAEWKVKGEKSKDKNGKAYTGWIAYSVECRKK